MRIEKGDEGTISPVYLYIINELDKLLGGNLNVRRRDSVYNDHIVLDSIVDSNEKPSLSNNELCIEYKKRIESTCYICGNNHSSKHYPDKNNYADSILCGECFENLTKEQQALYVCTRLFFKPSVNDKIDRYTISNLFQETWIWNILQNIHSSDSIAKERLSFSLRLRLKGKKIRIINPFLEFDYIKFGNYFFYDDGLYVITNKVQYQDYDIKTEFKKTPYYKSINPQHFLIKAFYAGQDTELRDINDERIYTGDVIKFNGIISGAGIKPDIENVETIGPISLSLKSLHYCPENFLKPAFLYDMYDDVICTGRIEILGNVFHKLTPNQNIDVNGLVNSWYWDVYNKNAYSHILRKKAQNKVLSNIKTPNY